jgi:hypothetical protein
MDNAKRRVELDDEDKERFVKSLSEVINNCTKLDAVGAFYQLQKALEKIYYEGYNRGFQQGFEVMKSKMN